MSLGTKLVQAVQKEALMQRPLPLQAAAHEDRRSGRVTASVTLTDNDRFSHMAEAVAISVAPAKVGTAPRGSPSVQEKAQRFAERASYLTESLQFVETDCGGTAVLRSSPETMRTPRSPYYEAQVTSSELTLHRYQPHTDQPGREAIPFCVTDEVLTRLVDDAAAVLAPPKK